MGYKLVVFLVFPGSVFAVSERFVDAEVAPKFYFTALAVPLGLMLLMFGLGNSSPAQAVNKLTAWPVLKGLFVVGVMQAAYGLMQYAGLLPLKSSVHVVLGSFDNPAGFAAVLSLLFPIGCYWSKFLTKINDIFFSEIIQHFFQMFF